MLGRDIIAAGGESLSERVILGSVNRGSSGHVTEVSPLGQL